MPPGQGYTGDRTLFNLLWLLVVSQWMSVKQAVLMKWPMTFVKMALRQWQPVAAALAHF